VRFFLIDKPEQSLELLKGALEEAKSLDSFVTNILNMTRLETGNIKFHREWIRVCELTGNITKRLAHRLNQREVAVDFPESDVEANMDGLMTGQVLQNLIENACKYTPPYARIDIRLGCGQCARIDMPRARLRKGYSIGEHG